MKRLTAATAMLALVGTTTGGCSLVDRVTGGSTGTYTVTAVFPKAPSIYVDSRVRVMGADVGSVRSIKLAGDKVRISLTVDRRVRIPADVKAGIVNANTIGERYVSLYPTWKPGAPQAPAGTVIPPERTELPVEPDEALAAFTKLGGAIDPATLRRTTRSGAQALGGHGQDINSALRSTSALTHSLAAQDRQLIGLAKNLRTVAAQLNRSDQRLGPTISSLSSASTMLAAERTRLRDFIAGLAAVIEKSGTVITSFEETLPGSMADLSNVILTLKTNSASLSQVVSGLGAFSNAVVEAWDRKNHVARIRLAVGPTVRAWLQPLFNAMGWGKVPCIPDNAALDSCPSPSSTDAPTKGRS